jgi:DNA polymerase IV (DinB-like DNA polymerase)
MERVRKFADRFEQVSIDEAFLDVTRSCLRYGGPIELAKRVKAELRDSEGLNCSIGIAPNKSTAKIASDFQKPDGLTYVDPEHVKEFLAPLPVSKISGIGKKTEFQLNQLGIKTIGDLAKYPPKVLYKRFGKSAVWLWAIANAEEQVEVQENYVMKSIGAEHTFDADTDDWSAIDYQLLALVDFVHKRLLDENLTFRTVTVKVRFTGFETYTRAKTLRFPTFSKKVIVDSIRALTDEFRGHPRKIRLIGIRISGLEGKTEKLARHTLDSFAAANP